MPWYDLQTNADAVLDAIFGSTTIGPATFHLRLWTDDPLAGGTEVTNTATLARLSITNNTTNFPAAVNGVKTCASFTLTATGATDAATWMSLHNSVTGLGWWRSRMADEWEAIASGDSVVVSPVIHTPDESLEDM
jgi:hypothetical protein